MSAPLATEANEAAKRDGINVGGTVYPAVKIAKSQGGLGIAGDQAAAVPIKPFTDRIGQSAGNRGWRKALGAK